jgi:hypothetical protein
MQTGLKSGQVGRDSNPQPAVLENAALCLVPSRAVSLPLLIGAECPPPSHAVSARLPIMLSTLLSTSHLAAATQDEAKEVASRVWFHDEELSKKMRRAECYTLCCRSEGIGLPSYPL